jgi:hypothetical protein
MIARPVQDVLWKRSRLILREPTRSSVIPVLEVRRRGRGSQDLFRKEAMLRGLELMITKQQKTEPE